MLLLYCSLKQITPQGGILMNTQSIIAVVICIVFFLLLLLFITMIIKKEKEEKQAEEKERQELQLVDKLVGEFNLEFSNKRDILTADKETRESLNNKCKEILLQAKKIKDYERRVEGYGEFQRNLVTLRREMAFNGETYL